MAQAGFENDIEGMRPRTMRSAGIERQRAIATVMHSGGQIRHMIERGGIKLDTSSWQGRPGEDVARELINIAFKLPLPEDPDKAARQVQALDAAEDALFLASDTFAHDQ